MHTLSLPHRQGFHTPLPPVRAEQLPHRQSGHVVRRLLRPHRTQALLANRPHDDGHSGGGRQTGGGRGGVQNGCVPRALAARPIGRSRCSMVNFLCQNAYFESKLSTNHIRCKYVFEYHGLWSMVALLL